MNIIDIANGARLILEQEKVGGNNEPLNEEKSFDLNNKPNQKSIDLGNSICNRLYFDETLKPFNIENDIIIGVRCKDAKLNIIKMTLQEFKIQQNGVLWVEYITYCNKLIWDIFYMNTSFDKVANWIQSIQSIA